MTTQRQWQHSVAYDSNGTGVASDSIAISGNRVVSGGGFATAIDYNGNGASNTDTSPSSANAAFPIVFAYTTYDAPSNTTYLNVGFAVSPGGKVRAHLFATWDA